MFSLIIVKLSNVEQKKVTVQPEAELLRKKDKIFNREKDKILTEKKDKNLPEYLTSRLKYYTIDNA